MHTAFAGAGVAAVGAMGAAVAKLGVDVFNTSQQLSQGVRDIQSELGVTEADAERLGEVVERVFANNFYGSVTEVTDALIEARKQLGALTDEELQDAIENAARLQDAFEIDPTESLSAVRTLMTEFNLSQQEAYDFLARGFQSGLNSSDDFIDSINEYGPLFAEGRGNAAQFFSLMETGMKGGVLGTDKINDAFKEFQIRFLEGNDDLRSGFSDLGLSYDHFQRQVNAGKMDIVDVFQAVINRAGQVDMSIISNQAALAKFGTQFEDLGASAVLGVDMSKTSMNDLMGAVNELDTRYNSLDQVISGIWRQAIIALTPVTDEMLRMANEAAPAIQASFERAQPSIEAFANKLSEAFGPDGFVTQLSTTVGPRIDEFATKLSTDLGRIGESITTIKNAFEFGDGVTKIDALAFALDALATAATFPLQQLADTIEGIAGAIEWAHQAGQDARGMFNEFLKNAGMSEKDLAGNMATAAQIVTPGGVAQAQVAGLTGFDIGSQLAPYFAELAAVIIGQPAPAVTVSVDGRELANVITPRVSAQVGQQVQRNLAGGGVRR